MYNTRVDYTPYKILSNIYNMYNYGVFVLKSSHSSPIHTPIYRAFAIFLIVFFFMLSFITAYIL